MQAADLRAVPDAEKTQSPVDLFLIIAGANLVATTLQTGASLAPAFGVKQAAFLVAGGVILGTGLVAALGLRGGALVSLILYVTNFAWIAVNNVIAASACARLFGGPSSERFWAFGLGLLATAVVAGGPRAVGHADRVAVPLLLLVGGVLTFACLRLPASVSAAPGNGSMTAVRGPPATTAV